MWLEISIAGDSINQAFTYSLAGDVEPSMELEVVCDVVLACKFQEHLGFNGDQGKRSFALHLWPELMRKAST